MKYMIYLSQRNKGFILLPIILTLAVLAAIALMISREAAINAGNVIREHQPETISYVGAAGLAIGEKELKQDTDCSAYTVTGSSVFNGKNYTSSITPNNGSPVTLKVDVDQGGGVSRQFVRQVKMYDSTPTGQVLNPSQDSHSRLSNSTTNYNSGAEANRLHVNYSIFLLPDRISYLQFDLSGVTTPVEEIQSVTLELHSGGTPESNSVSVGVNRIKNDWLEDQVTYNQRKTGVNWIPTDIDPTASAQTVVNENVVGWKTWDVTDLVKGWLAGTYPNYGMALFGQVGNTNNLEFISQNDPDTSKRPILRITSPCECGQPCSIPPVPGTLTVNPVADTYLYENSKNTNFGTSTILYLGTDTSGKKDQGLIQFDISTIPAGATITSAKLRLYKTTAGGSGTVNIGAYKLTTGWVETSATWNNMAGSSNYAATQLAQTTLPLSSTGWVEWNLSTTVITEWLGGTPNYGLALVYEGVNNAYGKFSSRESTTNKPELVIDYTTP